jgi:TP901 family phage tail tape measure protein
MADEIVQQLGFDVDAALAALRTLDNALYAGQAAFRVFGTALDEFNNRGRTTLEIMRELASAADRLANATERLNVPTTPTPAAAGQQGSQLWLPPGLQSAAQQAARTFRDVGDAAQQAAEKTTKGMQSAADATQEATKHSDHLIVSWSTISRVVMTQAIVRAMSMLRDALKESVTAAEEFQIRLAEIQTITPRIGVSLQSLGTATPFHVLEAEVTRFAKEFNVPLPQVQEGLYQTISNQFTSVADRAHVMTAAMELAKVGVMDLQQAILLITGTLNAYGMQSNQAESVAAKFFETIRLGRVRGKELADVMGQIMPIARELGVSLDELNSAMVSMTIAGMDAHKSATALRSVMTAFIKPSEDMTKVLRSMGFSDPSQIIAAKNFQGALQAISEAADGMGAEIAKSVRNVRALTAELRLASEEGAKKYREAMEAMQRASPEGLRKIVEEFRSTDTDRLQTQVNALKVSLTQDLGQAMIRILATMMEFMGGADKMAAAISAIAAGAAVCAASLVALAAGFALVNLSLGPFGIALLAGTAILATVTGASTYYTLTTIANIQKESDARHEATMKMLADEEKKIAKWKEVQQAEAQKAQGSWSEQAAGLRRDYFKALDDLKEKNTETINSARTVMESMVAAQERVVSAYRNAANAAVKAVQESQNRVVALEANLADTRFKYAQKELTAEEQADNYRRRAMQLAREAAEELSRAKTPDQIQAALAAFQRAEAAAKEAESIAQATGNLGLKEDAERAVLAVMNMQLGAEKTLQQVQAEQALKLARSAALEQERLNTMKALMKSILTDLEAFDKQGAKDPRALAEQQARLQANLVEFRKQFFAGQKVDVSDLLAFDQLQRRVAMALAGGVSEMDIRQFHAIPKSLADLRVQIEQGIGPIRVLIQKSTATDTALMQELQGKTAEESANILEKRLMEARQRKINFGELERQVAAATVGLWRFQVDAKADLQKWLDIQAEMEDTFSFDLTSLTNPRAWREMVAAQRRATQRFKQQAEKFLDPNRVVDDRDVQALLQARREYEEAINPSAVNKAALDKFIERALEIKEKAQAMQKSAAAVEQERAPAIESEQRIQNIEEGLKAAKQAVEGTKEATEGAYRGAQNTTNALNQVAQTDMSGLTKGLDNATTAMWGLVMAASSFVPPDTSSLYAAHGGIVRRFAEGGPTGVDVVPAWLSPGEFVMNAASTRRFAAQLTAMNAGVQPVWRSSGGSVTNIGDINVTVNGGGSSRQTARSIAAEIRRELRRGTSTL